jgi:hypothetical protein
MLTRRLVLSLLPALCACRTEAPTRALPEQVADYRRVSLEPGSAPEDIAQRGVAQAVRAAYQGKARVAVEVYQMKSETSAFELVQKWRAEPGRVAFHSGRNFVVISSTLPQPELVAFSQALQRSVSGP